MKDLQKIVALENEISSNVKTESGCTVHFQYDGSGTVRAYTYNPRIKEFFLLYSATGQNCNSPEIECLETILAYVKSHKNEFNSYTIKWRK